MWFSKVQSNNILWKRNYSGIITIKGELEEQIRLKHENDKLNESTKPKNPE